MNPALLVALINEIALPELTRWLIARQQAGQVIEEGDIIAKLITDANYGIKIGEMWLAAHPPQP